MNGAAANSNGLAEVKSVERLVLPDGQPFAIERMPARSSLQPQPSDVSELLAWLESKTKVVITLDTTTVHISVRAAHELSLALSKKENWHAEGVSVEVPGAVWLVVQPRDGQEVWARLGTHADTVAMMFSRAEVPSDEEVTESKRREQAAQAERIAEQLAQEEKQHAKAREAEERAREAEEAERELIAEWRQNNAPHLRARPPKPIDDDVLSTLIRFTDDDSTSESAIVPIAKRLAIFAGGRPTVVSGGPEVLKSFASSEIALRIGLGESCGFGGAVPIELRGLVVHLDFENPGGHRTRERYRRLGGADALDRGLIRVLSPSISLDDPLAEQALTELLYGVAVCIVDSLQFASRHKSEHYSANLAKLGRVSARTGTVFIVILHPVKGWEKRQGLDRLDFVTGREVDTVLWLEKDARQVTTFTSIKNANGAGPIEPLRVRLVDEGEVDEVTGLSERVRFEAVGVATKPPARLTAQEKIRRRILRALEDEQLSYRGLREEVTGNNAAIQTVLAELVQVGDVVQDPETSLYALAGGGPSRSLDGDEISENTEKKAVPFVAGIDARIGDASTSRSIEKIAVPCGPLRSLDPPVPASPPPVRGGTRTGNGGKGSAS